MDDKDASDRIPDTPLFDRKRSLAGYRINKMAMGLSKPENREAFRQDESAYLDRFGLTPEETEKSLANLEFEDPTPSRL